MLPEAGLARFQHLLLQLLWEEDDPATVRQKLLADASLTEFHSYIGSMEDRMLKIAAELVHKWGRS